MKETDDLEIFVTQLEAALVTSDIPRDKWKRYLHSQLTLESKQKVMHLLQEPESTYDEIRAALMGCAAMTFAAAAEAIFSADKGKLVHLPVRQVVDKVRQWLGKLTQEAETIAETLDCVTVGVTRSLMIPELKTHVDMSKATELQPFLRVVEEWDRNQQDKKSMFKQTGGYV